ncbi:MAG TPA: hypothetical protein PLL00_03225 [Bacteroidia bacterium]|jgi:uncharacterized membrane protein YidH (DUF202 family)|nr:hypothetical protein [Bacteroidia bacterium]
MTGIKLQYGWNKLRLYLSYFLLAFYLFIGGLFLFTKTWADLLPKGRFIIGIILTLFGIFRFYVAYRRYVNKNIKIEERRLLKENKKP